MPPYKEAPPGIVGFWIDFACKWYARQQLLLPMVMVLRQQEEQLQKPAAAQEEMEEERTQTGFHGKNAPWQNFFRHH